ncbi:MAG: lytic transglycosylase domain-containing protein [Bdellovibrionales bacterium]|nr:lytic transglycosylase domain-containing protein [Bdellovibrionales bacterium]
MNTLKSKAAVKVAVATAALLLSNCSTTSNTKIVSGDLDQVVKSKVSDVSKVGEGEGVRLSQAINQNLKTEMLTEGRKALLAFINTKFNQRKGGLLDESYEECKTKFKNAPECAFVKSNWSDSWFEDGDDGADEAEVALKIQDRETSQKKDKTPRRVRQKALNALVAEIRKGSYSKVENQREGDYYRAFKRFDSWTPELSELAKKVLEQKECQEPEIYNYLGLKAEEFFPSDELLATALQLYSRSDECAIQKPEIATSKYVQSARFRMALLSVMRNDCNTAQKVFTRLAKIGVSDYSTRAHYWNAYCAKSASDREAFQYSFDELFRTNPLGFHTLTLNHGDSTLVGNLSTPIDPVIKLRTDRDSTYNTWLSLIEDFDKTNNEKAVYKLLAPVRKTPEYLKVLEPRVRLYLATFAFRSRDTISIFRILDSVFRAQSEYVVDSTLKLFYPMKHFDMILSQVKHVHPFLVTALIRQESAFQENARSRVGAAGLMQLMPRTARLMDRKVTRRKLYDAETNIRVGVQYFEKLVDRYNGDVELALAAYNAGAEVVDKWAKRYPMKNRLLFLDLIPYAETRNYVTLIGRNYYWYSKLYADLLNKQGIAQLTPSEFRAMKSGDEPVKQ